LPLHVRTTGADASILLCNGLKELHSLIKQPARDSNLNVVVTKEILLVRKLFQVLD
ncbi:hypothetical protein NPIL_575971, partial [Nephila pilipes]